MATDAHDSFVGKKNTAVCVCAALTHSSMPRSSSTVRIAIFSSLMYLEVATCAHETAAAEQGSSGAVSASKNMNGTRAIDQASTECFPHELCTSDLQPASLFPPDPVGYWRESRSSLSLSSVPRDYLGSLVCRILERCRIQQP